MKTHVKVRYVSRMKYGKVMCKLCDMCPGHHVTFQGHDSELYV